MPQKIKDLTNKKFGILTVLKRAAPNELRPGAQWWCQCECGNKTICRGSDLLYGSSKSCGCLKRKVFKKLVEEKQERKKAFKKKSKHNWMTGFSF